ncbi:uroporphyrinogen-III synthase [Salipaludibacillus sp. CUR1]|uniref:uroporphyrinogen-III synthase n=1 Tax=Salipaludibacillus sp. CUR1 TaxID=2820003 RepID=UPI001E2B1E34|nr:uroporphyrinogen-III synthase [Salipaludibacillus sp. CUR1]MCE7791150.1 uroporphyrinogen-III synthase [Salipaludibacillus sp. CUR1]
MSLSNKRVVIAGLRKTDEISTLIKNHHGIPLVRSLQGTVFFNSEEVKKDLEQVAQATCDWMIFTTGIGVNALIDTAEEINLKSLFLEMVSGANVASRGYKTFSALKKLGVSPQAKDDDGTINGLISSLKPFDFKGKRVMVQLHGENAPSLITFLEEAGADVLPVLPYKHVSPNLQTMERFCQEVISGEVDAVCFTAAVQVHFLFKYASENGYMHQLTKAFNSHTVAAAVGKVTAEALHGKGIEQCVQPDLERMGAMIVELSHYFGRIKE